MSQEGKRVTGEGAIEDRLIDLPRNVIDHILELLPAKDAARTSILSRKWRYIWAMLPYLRLNCHICDDEAVEYPSLFKQTVYEILLQHIGDIVKFDLSGIYMTSHGDIDKWIHYVIRNGVKELTLYMYNKTTYKLPSYVFNCTTLTHLELSSCVFNPPDSFVDFRNLKWLRLEVITFVPTTEFLVISAPLLVSFDLIDCHDTQYLRIVSPQLERLDVQEIHYLLLNCFINCQKLRKLYIAYLRVPDKSKHHVRTALEKLLSTVAPLLEHLNLDSVFFELMSADTIPKAPPFTFNSLWFLVLNVDFGKLSHTSGALQFIKRVPNLSELEIWVDDPSDNSLETSVCLNQPLNKLKHVTIQSFRGSKTEMLFLKLLFACTPSLVSLGIKPEMAFDSTEETRIITELLSFVKAFDPDFQLCYYP